MTIEDNEWFIENYMKRFGPCDCYECVGSEFYWDEETGHKFVKNNSKRHTFLESCERCGKPKTEYTDLGRKGYYTCWWCEERESNYLNQNRQL